MWPSTHAPCLVLQTTQFEYVCVSVECACVHIKAHFGGSGGSTFMKPTFLDGGKFQRVLTKNGLLVSA